MNLYYCDPFPKVITDYIHSDQQTVKTSKKSGVVNCLLKFIKTINECSKLYYYHCTVNSLSPRILKYIHF